MTKRPYNDGESAPAYPDAADMHGTRHHSRNDSVVEAEREKGGLTDHRSQGDGDEERVEEAGRDRPAENCEVDNGTQDPHAKKGGQKGKRIREPESGDDRVCDERPEHVEVTLGKVEDLNDSQDQGKAGSDESIHSPAHQPVDEDPYEKIVRHVSAPCVPRRARRPDAAVCTVLLLDDIFEIDHARLVREFRVADLLPILLVDVGEAVNLDGNEVLVFH